MSRRIFFAASLLLLSFIIHASGAGAYQGNQDEQVACTPDVLRLCTQFIPDEAKIVACLNRHSHKLSSGCAAVMNSDAAAAPAPRPAVRSDNSAQVIG
jgi:hypothetical protein